MKQFTLTLVVPLLILLPSTAAETVDAVWRVQDVDFTFMSLEMAYSCDVIEGKTKILLRHVGAADVHVAVPSCGGFKDPRRQHRIPAGDGDIEVVRASWSEAELGKWHPRSIDDHELELLEQFQKYLLSTIQHEVMEGETGYGATKRSIVGRLKLKVLKTVAEDDAAKENE